MKHLAARSFSKAHWMLLLLLLIAAVWLYRSPYSASNLEILPDTVEYALAPLELLETGHYQIIVEGRALPPRYPPWFSGLLILPAYVLFGHDPGNAILPVTAMSVAGIGFAWMIGRQVSGSAGGILAALILLFNPSYTLYSKQVMTDVPSTALMLVTCLVYFKVRERPQCLRLYWWAGTLIALTALFRPVFAGMLSAFLLTVVTEKRMAFLRLIALLMPMLAAIAITLAYNAAAFGSALRNGYHFWSAVPHDYLPMMFAASNVQGNVGVLTRTPLLFLLLGCLGAWLVARLRSAGVWRVSQQPIRHLCTFFILTTAPILLFHLFYFFPSARFHLPLLAAGAVILGSLSGLIIEQRLTRILKLLVPIVLLFVLLSRLARIDPLPLRRLAAERVRRSTPESAIVISAIDPVYLDRLAAHGSARQIVPISRNVEYATKVLAPKRIEHPQPPPRDWHDGRALGLRCMGAQDAVRFVASEQLEAIAAEVTRGRPVFLEATYIGRSDSPVADQLKQRFSLVERAPHLYQLLPL